MMYKFYTQYGTWTHNPEMKSHILPTEQTRCSQLLISVVLDTLE